MTSEKFNQLLEETLDKCKNTLGVKAEEYATSDRLHNFKVAADLQNCTPMSALAGMMAKHTVSVYDLIGRVEYGVDVPLELWDEKIGDHINYLILLSALVREDRKEDVSCKNNLSVTGGDSSPYKGEPMNVFKSYL